jgi:hypothetical protein
MPMTLLQAIRQFTKDMSHLRDPKRCWCLCDYTSEQFIRFCQRLEVPAKLKTYAFELESVRNPAPWVYQLGLHPIVQDSVCDWHCIVEAPDFYIDFTVRQYKHTAQHPLIIRKVTKRNRALTLAAGGGK